MPRVIKQGKGLSMIFQGLCEKCEAVLEEDRPNVYWVRYDSNLGLERGSVNCPVCEHAVDVYAID